MGKQQPLIHAMQAELQQQGVDTYELLSLEALFPDQPEGHTEIHAMKATSDPDTMYFHEAMREPDKAEFLSSKERDGRSDRQRSNRVNR